MGLIKDKIKVVKEKLNVSVLLADKKGNVVEY